MPGGPSVVGGEQIAVCKVEEQHALGSANALHAHAAIWQRRAPGKTLISRADERASDDAVPRNVS